MIYYFSATGNSRHVAKRLAEALDEQTMSILDAKQPVSIAPGERFVLVYPNYCGGLPSVVAEFLQNGKFRLATDSRLVLVVTYGNNTGASSAIAAKYFKKNIERSFDALYSVKMPDNWTPVFDLSDAAEVAEINRKADAEIDGVIEKMKQNAAGDFVRDKLGRIMELVYPGFYKKLLKTSHLKLEESCIGCGLCAKNCPVSAIEMKDGKPAWTKARCAMCLGCLHRCPAFAIQYEGKTKNHGQYFHPDEKQ